MGTDRAHPGSLRICPSNWLESMDAEVTDRGSRRRARMRRVLGGPGSVRRWLLGSLVFVILAGILFVHADFLGRIAIFILGSVLVLTAFRARSLVIGDEDELRASMRRDRREARYSPEAEEEKILLDDEEWERLQEILRLRDMGHGDAWPIPMPDPDGANGYDPEVYGPDRPA